MRKIIAKWFFEDKNKERVWHSYDEEFFEKKNK